eukprot:g985.t1
MDMVMEMEVEIAASIQEIHKRGPGPGAASDVSATHIIPRDVLYSFPPNSEEARLFLTANARYVDHKVWRPVYLDDDTCLRNFDAFGELTLEFSSDNSSNDVTYTPADFKKLFHAFHFGAHKADLCRYHYVYARGGVMIDADALLAEPLTDIVDREQARYVGIRALFQSFSIGLKHSCMLILGATARNPILRDALRDMMRWRKDAWMWGPVNWTDKHRQFLVSDLIGMYRFYLSQVARTGEQIQLQGVGEAAAALQAQQDDASRAVDGPDRNQELVYRIDAGGRQKGRSPLAPGQWMGPLHYQNFNAKLWHLMHAHNTTQPVSYLQEDVQKVMKDEATILTQPSHPFSFTLETDGDATPAWGGEGSPTCGASEVAEEGVKMNLTLKFDFGAATGKTDDEEVVTAQFQDVIFDSVVTTENDSYSHLVAALSSPASVHGRHVHRVLSVQKYLFDDEEQVARLAEIIRARMRSDRFSGMIHVAIPRVIASHHYNTKCPAYWVNDLELPKEIAFDWWWTSPEAYGVDCGASAAQQAGITDRCGYTDGFKDLEFLDEMVRGT